MDKAQTAQRTGSGNAPSVEAHAKRLGDALKSLFRECAMVHKYWGEACNQAAADAAVTEASSALHAWELAQ